MAARILIPLAPGFEEMEAVILADVLRRAELEVTVVGLTPGPEPVAITGSRGVKVEPDATWESIDPDSFDWIVLPGGLGGTEAMMEHAGLVAALQAQRGRGGPIAAICAAPMVLVRAGLEADLELTGHPSVHGRLGQAKVNTQARVLRDGAVWTSQGPGTAMEFALALVGELVGPDKAQELAVAMVTSS